MQDRLPKELALAGIRDVEVANHYIREVYLPAHNARFAVRPAEAGSAFVPVSRAQWHDILCIQEERTVALDNTVAWQGKRLQISPHPARARFVRAKVKVHAWPDGTLAVFHGPRCLVRWHPASEPNPIEIAQPAPAASRATTRRGRRGQAKSLPTPPTPQNQKKAVNRSAT